MSAEIENAIKYFYQDLFGLLGFAPTQKKRHIVYRYSRVVIRERHSLTITILGKFHRPLSFKRPAKKSQHRYGVGLLAESITQV